MFKTIKAIYNIFAEEAAKEKAAKKICSQMTLEEYKTFKGCANNLRKRSEFIDYKKSLCDSTAEYNMNPKVVTCQVVGIKENPTRRKTLANIEYMDNSRYAVTTEYGRSINEDIKKEEQSKDFKTMERLISKYS